MLIMGAFERGLQVGFYVVILTVVGLLGTFGVWTLLHVPAPLNFFSIGMSIIALTLIGLTMAWKMRW